MARAYLKSELEKGVVFRFYRSKTGKVKFLLYQTINESNFGFVMGSRKTDGYSISQSRNQKKKPDQYGLSWNPEYSTANKHTNLHYIGLGIGTYLHYRK